MVLFWFSSCLCSGSACLFSYFKVDSWFCRLSLVISEWKCAGALAFHQEHLYIWWLKGIRGREETLLQWKLQQVNRLSVVGWDLIYYLWDEAEHFSPFEVWINVLWSICLNFLSGLFLNGDCHHWFSFLWLFSVYVFFIFVLCKGWNAHTSQAPVLQMAALSEKSLVLSLVTEFTALLDRYFNFINSFLEFVKIFW